MKVADLVAEFFERHGVRHVFGIVGAGNVHIFDAINRRGYTQIVCTHHEQAAVMAAQTYFRVSGKVTLAIVTTGAGSTNAVTGVVGAWADSIPVLVLSGNEHSKHTTPNNPLRMWGVQGYDSSLMVEKVTKLSRRVTDPEQVISTLEEAYALASAGRPGPCWIDVPMDVQAAQAAEIQAHAPTVLPPPSADTQSVDALLEILRSAQRPLLWLGHGIRLAGAIDLLPELLERTRAPALVSWAGADMVDSAHPQVVGRAGVYGQRAANFILQNCDALICLGTRLAVPQIGYDLTELAREARIAVVDIDPTEAHKLEPRVELAVVADAGEIVRAMIKGLTDDPAPVRTAWLTECQDLQERFPLMNADYDDRDGYLNSYRFLDKLTDHLADDEVIVTDMGTALLSGHQILQLTPPQRLMTSTGLGEMGFGLPGAVGASFGRDKGRVLCLNCDGGMMMNLQELEVVVHHQLPVKIVVFNNDGYLMIKHTQKSLFEGRYTGTDVASGVSCPDFSAVATGFEIPSFQVRTFDEIDTVVPKFLGGEGPALLEVFTHPEQLFAPKLSVATMADGSLVSPPLEDLSPFVSRADLRGAMRVGVHEKSLGLGAQF